MFFFDLQNNFFNPQENFWFALELGPSQTELNFGLQNLPNGMAKSDKVRNEI